ncbi:hypothetical protein V9L05_18455 [Bernardetia sp. Wsw4-3y2]|uniref:hypothetical protein n=1 Tax=unclassified Bernardetia TaxID=2647129 RepID=UPI0030CE6642
MILKPGESYEVSTATITVTNLSNTKNGSFSVTGASYILEPDETKRIDLMEEPDRVINSGSTNLNVD